MLPNSSLEKRSSFDRKRRKTKSVTPRNENELGTQNDTSASWWKTSFSDPEREECEHQMCEYEIRQDDFVEHVAGPLVRQSRLFPTTWEESTRNVNRKTENISSLTCLILSEHHKFKTEKEGGMLYGRFQAGETFNMLLGQTSTRYKINGSFLSDRK